MSSGERDSLNLGFPYRLCYRSVCCNISAMAGQNIMKFSHQGKSPTDSKYDVRIDVLDPQTRQPLISNNKQHNATTNPY